MFTGTRLLQYTLGSSSSTQSPSVGSIHSGSMTSAALMRAMNMSPITPATPTTTSGAVAASPAGSGAGVGNASAASAFTVSHHTPGDATISLVIRLQTVGALLSAKIRTSQATSHGTLCTIDLRRPRRTAAEWSISSTEYGMQIHFPGDRTCEDTFVCTCWRRKRARNLPLPGHLAQPNGGRWCVPTGR